MGRDRGRGGRRGGRGGRNKGGDNNNAEGGGWRPGQQPWQDIVPTNEQFDEYYKGQNICTEEEWVKAYKSLQSPLPTTFRITSSGHFAEVLTERIKQAGFQNPEPFEIDGEIVEPPHPISWYPDNLAWQTNIPRKTLRKNANLENFHKFLMTQTDQGNITRQEAVSMLPPLFLDVEPHHTVLDICAAPGSKTTQIIEKLHKDGHTTVPSGLVIANDVDKQRCYMLVHHTKRLASPAIMVTNHPAQQYPRLPIRLDRILADVPCSGDGTLRKNVDLWRRWSPQLGIGLHVLQLRIAVRAAQMLAVGGRMVYSTCSLNPIEDEAVVMELMRITKGSLRLMDASTTLPGLKYAPGINTWRVMDRDGNWFDSFDQVPEGARNRIRPSMFKPTPEEAAGINIDRCMRLLPHHQNTGGFFVAVIEKVDRLPDVTQALARDRRKPFVRNEVKPEGAGEGQAQTQTQQGEASAATAPTTSDIKPEANTDAAAVKTEDTKVEADAKAVKTEDIKTEDSVMEEDAIPAGEDVVPEGDDDLDAEADSRIKGKQKKRTWIEEPFLPLPAELTPVIESLKDYYGLTDFPVDQMFARSTKNQKLYFVSKSIGDIIRSNEVSNLSVINTGVKLFNSHEKSAFKYRLCQDALQWFLPLIKKRKISLSHNDLIRILTNPTTHPNDLSRAEQFKALDQGCVVLVVEDANSPSDGMGFVSWLGKSTVQFLLKKKELNSLKSIFIPNTDKAKDKAKGKDKQEIKEETTTSTPTTTATTTTPTTTTTTENTKREAEGERAGQSEENEDLKRVKTE